MLRSDERVQVQGPSPGSTLRPLGLGEILDRAVNLCVRFFFPLISIYLVYAIPLAVLTFFSTKQLQAIISVVTDTIQNQAHGTRPDPDAITRAINASNAAGASIWPFVALIFTFFFSPLPTAALVEATTAFYLGRTSSFKQAYRVALDRYWNMLGINVLFGAAGGVVYLVVVLVVVFAVFGIAALAVASHVAAIALGVVLGLVALCVGIAFAIVVVLALQIAYFTCVVERANFAVSFMRAIKRVFTGIGLGRSLLVGLIYLAIAIGIGLVSGVGEIVLLGLLHSAAIGTVYQTLVRIATAAFTTSFIGIFYLDLRVREEGLDLQLAAERANAQTIAPIA